MKHKLLTVGTALVLLPLFSTQVQADSSHASSFTGPDVLLRCREMQSSSHSVFEQEQSEHYTARESSMTERRESRTSHIREILRRHETSHVENAPVVIEIQGDCDAIQVEIGTEYQQDELFPGELDHSRGYEEWREMLRYGSRDSDRPEPYPWLTRTGSGWDWLLRQRDSSVRQEPTGQDR